MIRKYHLRKKDKSVYFIRLRPSVGESAPEDPTRINFAKGNRAGLEIVNNWPTIESLHAWHEKNNPHRFSKKTPSQIFQDNICIAIQKTDIDEREDVALEFAAGSSHRWPSIARRGIDPLALLVASLIDAESPLVMRSERLIHGSIEGTAAFVRSYRPGFLSASPLQAVDKSPKPVDNFLKTVGNSPIIVGISVDVVVDNLPTFPQGIEISTEMSEKPISYPHIDEVIHILPVDNS